MIRIPESEKCVPQHLCKHHAKDSGIMLISKKYFFLPYILIILFSICCCGGDNNTSNTIEYSCYKNACHPEKAIEFDPLNPSHHHVEGVWIEDILTDVIACWDCHNPRHNTIKTILKEGYLINHYSKADLYPAVPLPEATLPIISGLTGLPVSGLPFFVGNTNATGVPAVDLFCLECHAPDIFVPPNPPWPGAPNISFEINNKYYALGFTTSNFFYPHQHLVGSPCSACHITKAGLRPMNTLNGHFTHLKNASCTYCHDPHGTLGSFVGGTVSGIIGTQRGHLLKDWLLADSTAVSQLPYGGGYLGAGIYSSTTITKVDGASSCFINDPLGGCHDITHIHKSGVIKTNAVCNGVPCHLTFTSFLLHDETSEERDTIAPAPPR
jgi:hypothetical protein